MHIPDGFLSPAVAGAYGILAVSGIGLASVRAQRSLHGSRPALLGVSAAFLFAAQMINFPVAGGTSGHLIGGVLASILLGLPSAILVVTSVILVQCFVFGDGGVLALGANVFNMAIVSCAVGYSIYRLFSGRAPGPVRRIAAASFAAWCATVAAATSCAEQLAISRAAPASIVLPAMTGVHAIIGIGEAVITAAVIAAILRFRPDLLDQEKEIARPAIRSVVVHGLGLTVSLAALLAPFACSWPDGLDRVAEDLGFKHRQLLSMRAPFADYTLWGSRSLVATAIVAASGTLVMFGASWLLAFLFASSHARKRWSGIRPESSG